MEGEVLFRISTSPVSVGVRKKGYDPHDDERKWGWAIGVKGDGV